MILLSLFIGDNAKTALSLIESKNDSQILELLFLVVHFVFLISPDNVLR